jgi:hypothetical protein
MKFLLSLVCALLVAAPVFAEPSRVLNSDVLVMQSAAGATGAGLPLNVDGYNTAAFEVTISGTATITFEGSTNAVFSAIPCINKATGASATTATATGLYQCDVAGLNAVQTRISTYSSGTVTSVGRASIATSSSAASSSTPLVIGDLNSGTAFYSNVRDNITTSSVNLAFGFTSKKVAIQAASANTDEVCIDWLGGTAVCPSANTAGDDRLIAGQTIILDQYAVTSLSVIANSGTQKVYVRAWQ